MAYSALPTNEVQSQIVRLTKALFDAAPGYSYLTAFTGSVAASDMVTLANSLTYYVSTDAATLTNTIVASLDLTGDVATAAAAYLNSEFAANPGNYGKVVLDAMNALSGMEADPAFGAAAQAFNASVAIAYGYSINVNNLSTDLNVLKLADELPTVPNLLTLTAATLGTSDTMRLTGNADIRIDLTANDNQVKGLDLDGDGAIEANGIENVNPTVQDDGMDFEIVDAYARNRANETDITANYLGDIRYDGTGFGGDGVSTDGNIVLGGLGADTILGGIGNDFLAGGGVATANPGTDRLDGGRNADFFFAELSLLDNTDGNRLTINGGSTTDDSAVGNNTPQDADWLLLEVSDDEDGTIVNLSSPTGVETSQAVTSGAGRVINMTEIENVDASGNLYGFLDNVDVALGGGGKMVDGENVGIGSSAQLRILGSIANNMLIGGYDNDRIQGDAGNDLLMGGNLNYAENNPNATDITNDGRDELIGELGNDNIIFEADGGRIEGDVTTDIIDVVNGNDTLWLTDLALGTQTAGDMTTDSVLRFDLDSQNIDAANGYGGANSGSRDGVANDTQDQTNYKTGVTRTTVQDMENVIATGLGAVDYDTDGTNAGDVAHLSQVNQLAYEGDLTLRGTAGANTLYASSGDDVIEGRAGNDKLSGGNGDDDFVFYLQDNAGDGRDVIHRQADANGDNLWDGHVASTNADGTFVQDFGQVSAAITANSKLTLTLIDTAHPADLTGFPVNGVSFTLDGVTYSVPLTSGIQSTYAAFNDGLNAALDANSALAALNSVLNADNTMTITDPAGKAFVSVGYTFVGNIVPPAGTLTWNQLVGGPSVSQTQDRLIYRSYEDRLDGELVDDDASTGSSISLGLDAYAEDLVVSFQADGTRIAEDQSYDVTFTNLTTQDIVTTTVNGVTYQLQVGVDLDGNSIAGEDSSTGATQAAIQTAFLTRYEAFIDSFMDNDTAVGQINATLAGSTITLNQVAYNGEETVFMVTPTVAIQNLSNGEIATATVTNTSQHEVLLFNYDGRNLDGAGKNLDGSNVLFVGDTNVNQALLQTANNLTGGTITGTNADLVDGGANDLAGIANNTATNVALALNFSVHGDDFILGGAAVDTINAGTGDDRVQGSAGNDVLNGGKNYYAVKVLGETESHVVTWNAWEAANAASAQALLADPTLAGKTLTSITLIDQTESGAAPVVGSGAFNDTLIYAQNDFTTGATRFTVNLNNYTVNAGVVALNNGGAGTVGVDLTGDGVIDSTSTFTNFENVRTISGTGLAVAGVGGGQGNDTLDVSSLSTATGGISYDLTNRAAAAPTSTAGDVRYSTNADTADGGGDAAAALFADENDFETAIIKVDGVESVIGGAGNDLLMIDETEAAKDNSFTASLGADRIQYLNDFTGLGGAAEAVAQPTVTIKVNAAADTDTVAMTSGRVGTVVATDTLVSVERIALNGNTAEGSREADVLDVTTMTTGAVVDYTNGQVRDLAGNVQVTIENIAELENVWADGNDTVIVADNMGALNAREDVANGTAAQDIALATFIDYDTLTNVNVTNTRVAFASQTAAQIENVVNQNQYTFDMSRVGSDVDSDTVDYSGTLTAVNNDNISVRVELDANQANQYVSVDTDGVTFFDAAGDLAEAGDRIDVLTNVERIVASTGESVLDLTASTKSLEVVYQALDVANRVAALDRDVYNVQISDLSSSVPITRNYVEYRDAGLLAATATVPNQVSASWNRIEGSDYAERVVMNSAHSANNNTMNLRGGANEVKYNELTRSITMTLGVADFVATDVDGVDNILGNGDDTGLITGTVQFQDGTGAGVEGPMLNGTTDVITSYTANNGIATGSLRIAASQDAEDTLKFAGLTDKLFLISEVGTTDNQVTVKLGSGAAQNSIVLTGFELITDAAGNDVYDFGSLLNAAAGLNFIDTTTDHDTVKVANDATNAAFGGTATSISLAGINGAVTLSPAGFDFDVLDVTKITDAAVTTLNGVAGGEGSDEVVIGSFLGFTNANNFESVVLTQTAVTGQGTSFTLNTTANTLVAGAKTLTFNQDVNTLSFGGLALEGAYGAKTDLNATGNLTINMIGNDAVTLIGGDGNDSITSNGGNDTLIGGAGNDILNGGFVPEVSEKDSYTISANAGLTGGAGRTVIINGVTVTEGAATAGDPSATVVAEDDADAIGAAFVRVWNATPGAFTVNGATAAPNTIASVTYDALTNVLSFNYSAGMNAAGTLAAVAGTGAAAVSAVANTNFVAQVESQDTYVFGATAALNGVDTINNFNAAAAVTDDVLNFAAFLGVQGAAAAAATNLSTAGADLVLANGGVGVAYNKAVLSATDVVATATATVGEIVLADNSKAVVLVSADADGVADLVSNDAYNAYYIEDTNTAVGAQTWAVTKVATINSTAELAANNVLVEGLLIGSNAANTINAAAAAAGVTILGNGGADTITGSLFADRIVGGAGSDTISLGADANADVLVYTSASEGSDTVTAYVTANDAVEIDGALQTALDDITVNTTFAFLAAIGGAGVATAANATTTDEAISVLGAENGGVAIVTAANLTNLTMVAALLEQEITLTSAAGDDALIVVESTTGGTFGVYAYSEVAGAVNNFDAGDLKLLGVVTADAVTAADFIMV